MSEHTPGPWGAYVESTNAISICAAGELIADVVDADGQDVSEVMKANARLIAAAPDLLKLAKLLECSLVYEIKKSDSEGDEEGGRLKFFMLAEVRGVISRAEGDEMTITPHDR